MRKELGMPTMMTTLRAIAFGLARIEVLDEKEVDRHVLAQVQQGRV